MKWEAHALSEETTVLVQLYENTDSKMLNFKIF